MKLLPKSKPKNYRFIPKHVKVIKLTSTLLLVFTMQLADAKTERSIVFTDKNVKKNDPIQKKVTGKVTNEKGESLPGVISLLKELM